MMLDRLDSAASRRAQHHGATQAPARAASQTRGVIDDLVDASISKAGELDFGDRAKALGGEPNRDAGNRRFRKRRVQHALLTKAVEQALRSAKHAAIDSYVLAQDQNTGIFIHRALERGIDSLHQTKFGHAAPCAENDRRLPLFAKARRAAPHIQSQKWPRAAAVA